MSAGASRTLEEVRALARDYNLIPLAVELIADCETPVSAFLKLRGAGPAFLLESAEQGVTFGRYSFIGFQPREVIRWSLGEDGDPFAVAAAAPFVVVLLLAIVLLVRPGGFSGSST